MLYADEAEFDRVGTSKYPQMLDQGIDTVESVWRHKNGQLLNVLLSSSPLDLAGEKDGVVFTALDITARKQNEAAILQAKENWERTFNTIPDLIIILDTENRILQANQAMIHRLQAIPGEVVGRKCHQVVHNTQQPPAGCPHAQALKNGRTHTAEIWEENLGGVFLVTCSPLPDPEGKVVGTVHVARDITEQKRIEQELQQHRHHLEQLVAERTAGWSK